MKLLLVAFAGLMALSACGVDGVPLKPRYSAQTTVGYNSSTGPFNKTTLGVQFGG